MSSSSTSFHKRWACYCIKISGKFSGSLPYASVDLSLLVTADDHGDAGIRKSQEIKHDVGRQIGTEVHGSSDCRGETGTLNGMRSDDAYDRLARGRVANHGKRFHRCEPRVPNVT